MRQQLQEAFDYDLWANAKWLECLPHLGNHRARAEEILSHILKAQHIWLTRSLSNEEVADLPDDLVTGFNQLNAAWKEFIGISDPTAFVSYTNFSGESFFRMVEEIARHVINHGTYHRGHLRGLAEASGFEGFPETDFIRFLNETAPAAIG